MKILIIILLIFVGFLIIPLIFNSRKSPGFVGPKLAELEYKEITFQNQQEGFQLAGMLFLPDGEGSFPTAIIIHGSGTSQRDNSWYLSVVKCLQQNGIAVLLPDKRGSEGSEGEWVGSSFEELATDTLSAIEYVKNLKVFEHSAIGVIGMSQGGWIAPIVATMTNDLSFVVSMSGATVRTEEQLLHEEIYNMAPYTYTFIARILAAPLSKRLMKLPHLRAFAGFDPVPFWKKVQIPTFFAYGENDPNVPVEASIKRMQENNLDHFEVKVYSNGGHAIRNDQSNQMSEEFLMDLVRFIKESTPQIT